MFLAKTLPLRYIYISLLNLIRRDDIKRAMNACENSGHSVDCDFPEVRKINSLISKSSGDMSRIR